MQPLRKPQPAPPPSRRRRYAIAAGLAVVAILLLFYLRGDARISRVQSLRQQLTGEAGKKLSDEQKKELFTQLRAESEKLTPDQKRAMWEGAREQFQRQFDERLDRYFSLPPKDRVAMLDDMINQSEAVAKKFKSQAGGKGPAAGKGPAVAGKGGPPRQAKGASAEERERWRKDRLDKSTPEQRAKRAEFSRAMEQRRQQRGMPPNAFGAPRW